MTSECADVSIGLVEGRAGWNTVLTRSERGDALVQDAEDAALVEVVQLDRGRLSHLAEASLGKRRRAVATAAAQGRELPYLRQEGKRGSHHA
jgi:coenzyme F420 hydrogenase subunit beta